MAPSPQLITNNPLYLNARSLVYTAEDLRNPWGDMAGPGVQDPGSFKVTQRVAGANMSVDCTLASTLMKAFVRGSIITDQGIYRVDYNSATVINVDITAADATNPRIDQIYLCVEDQQHAGSNNQATMRLVTGTPTGGATLDNRTGAGAAPASMSSILLADILVPAASASVVTANIRDRRAYGMYGSVPPTFTAVETVAFEPAPPLVGNTGATVASAGTIDNQQVAALVFLPKRIRGATRIRWRYFQGTTAAATQFNIGIYDASMRKILETTPGTFSGALSTTQNSIFTITATDFDMGNYYLCFGGAAATASSTVFAAGIGGTSTSMTALPLGPNLFLFSATGGVVLPTTLAAFTDWQSVTGAPTLRGAVPFISLGVG